MPRLKEIALADNQLTSLDDRLFAAQLALQNLHLSGNRLVAFDLTTMPYASTLIYLGLDTNQLRSVKITPALEFLTADDNQLSVVETSNSDYYRLATLSVQNNSFSSLESIYRFDRLQELNVTLNRIAVLDFAMIATKFPRLTVLNASVCAVESLGRTDNPYELKELQHLDLSNNTLTKAEMSKMGKMPRLKTLFSADNRIHGVLRLLDRLSKF